LSWGAYLRRLGRPRSWNDLADFLSKTVFALAAAAIAVVTGCYNQARLENDRRLEKAEAALIRQEERNGQEQAALREQLSNRRDEITLFLSFMPRDDRDPQWDLKVSVLSSYCSEDGKEAATRGAVKVLCNEVGKLGDRLAASSKAAAAAVASRAAASGDSRQYMSSEAGARQNLALAASEAAAPATTEEWFAVVATVPIGQEEAVRALTADLNARLQRAGLPPRDVHVYRTRISNSYALTSGKAKTERLARERARMLRQAGAVPDAFPQPNRGWELRDDLRG
jgi:hypothetical protein